MTGTAGQAAYEAYCKTVNHQNLQPWEALSMDIRAGWEAAAQANSEADDPQTIREWQKAIHDYAKAKGWWDPEKPRTFGDLCALFHTEISEAFEEHRNGHGLTEVYQNEDKPGKWEGVPVELADLVIRVLDFAEWAGIDLQEVMARKHAYNLTRSYRHGGKRT